MGSAGDVVVGTVVVQRRRPPQSTEDLEELAGPCVALVVTERVAVGELLGRVAARDDVHGEPPAGQPLEARGLLRGERRQQVARAERNEEAQPLGERQQC